MSHRIITITLAFLLILTSGCNQANNPSDPTIAPTIDQMTFMAGYKPQANLPFVGVYIAKEKGYFAANNLDVIIQHSPGSGQHLQLVAQGKVQVTTQDAAILLKRRSDPGLPLVSIGLIGQKGQQAFAALKSSGFITPKDWENHLVGFKGTPPPDLFALIKAAGADLNKMELVNVGFDPRILTEGNVAVYPVFKSNEPFLMQQWGYEIDLWDATDYGIPSLGLAYVTSEETLANQSDILSRFMAASIDGILYAEQNPEEAVEIVLKYAGPETDRDHMRFMLETELKDLRSENTDQNTLGWHNLEKWQALVDFLVEYETMQPIDVSKAFTNNLLSIP
ncbi:MAG: ABC transporter substrate-binding protein [Anaerolineaceae bacterium]|nr:ABC transporter substrate-binding protein [Anaerolineaceae bacterium]